MITLCFDPPGAVFRGEHDVMTMHADYKFSVTIHSDNLAVINCLRALSKFSQKTGNNNIPWGGTKDKDWRAAGKQVTFRFSTPEYRSGFVNVAQELLRDGTFRVVDVCDDDPAQPQT